MPVSAGILVFSMANKDIRFLLAHPGGPYYNNKDLGSWGIPKGLAEEGETDLLKTAQREFWEETHLTLCSTDFIPLPVVKYKNGKTLHSWAVREDFLDTSLFVSNTFETEWPRKSGITEAYPEIDQLNFFYHEEACIKIHPVQLPLIQYLKDFLRL